MGSRSTRLERQLQLLVAGKSAPGGINVVSAEALKKEVGAASRSTPKDDHLYAAIRFEAGDKTLKPEELPNLAKAKDTRSQALFRLYTQAKVDDAAKLERTLSGNDFLDRLSRIHAREKAGAKVARDTLANPQMVARMMAAGIGVFLGLALGSGLLLWWALIGRNSAPRGFPALPGPPGREDVLAARSVQTIVVFLMTSLLGGLAIASFAQAGTAAKSVATLLVYAVMIALVLLVFRLPVLGRMLSLREIGWERMRLWHVLYGCGAAVANAPLVLLMSLVGQRLFDFLPPPEHPITETLSGGGGGWVGLAVVFFLACVAAPITEEIMFRGTMAPAMVRKYGSLWGGIVLSSLFFAAIHPTGIPAWPALATVGGMSAYLTFRTGSLMPSVAMHAFHNFCTLVLSLLIL
jgi:membrane protease YdiL (CAAX protease family)